MSDQPKHTGDMALLLPFTNERGEIEVIALGDVGPMIVASRQSIATLTDRLGVMREALEPFARVAEAAQHTHLRDGQCVWRVNHDGEWLELSRSDFRKAHAALQSDRTNHEAWRGS